ncbi:eCIS core domain-containing protein [Nostoc sp.]|uniref:eCIS core domain-containing protein n=1 Tax=Nostoc sp. TaxID=1180 RepID=UPI002FFB759E
MSDVGRQATGVVRTLGHQKSATSTFTNPALAFSTIPTFASPTRGFGLQTNSDSIQRVTEASIDLQEVQSIDEQLLEPQAIKQQPLNHDISRISLHRPQAKLTVGAPDDYYEQEADKVADQIMRMAQPQPIGLQNTQTQDQVQTKPLAAAITPLVQREAMPEEEEELQTKRSLQLATNGSFQTEENFETRLNSSESGGSPLPEAVRSYMEPRFGADFSQVRVHTGNESVQSRFLRT